MSTTNPLTAWSLAVRSRDGNACTRCGSRHQLHAHHKKPKSSHPELALVLSNGITLCQPCHFKEHATNKSLRLAHKPRRETLEKQIASMQARIDELEGRNAELLALIRKQDKPVKKSVWVEPIRVATFPAFDPSAMAMAVEGYGMLLHPRQESLKE